MIGVSLFIQVVRTTAIGKAGRTRERDKGKTRNYRVCLAVERFGGTLRVSPAGASDIAEGLNEKGERPKLFETPPSPRLSS